MELERLANWNAFEFPFDSKLLQRLAAIYEDVVAPQLDLRTLISTRVPAKLQGDGLRFHATPYGSLAWVSSDDLATHNEFQQLFDRLGLAAAVMPLVDCQERVVMYQGFYVVSDGIEEPTWHVDYFAGAHAYTLLTPLYELAPEHGHLLHLGHGLQKERYAYRYGVGVLVGEGFFHSTEPHPPGPRQRVLVSLTFGTDRMQHWPRLRRTVGTQSPFIVMPCGHPRGTCGCEGT